jgi:hypothetical protein
MSGSDWKPLDQGRWTTKDGAGKEALDPGRLSPNPLQCGLIAFARATPLRRGVFRATISRLVFLLGANKPFDGCAPRLSPHRPYPQQFALDAWQ